MTNDLIRRRFDAFARIEGFSTKHGSGFAAGSRGAKLFAEIAATVAAMRAAGADQLSGAGKYHGGTDAKLFWLGELKEDLAAIRDTAAAIAEAEDTPDFDDQFRLPRSSGYGAWLTAARAFLQDATPHRALFVEFELPADFLEDLAADIENFEDAEEAQDAGQGDQVGGTASLDVLAEKGMKARRQLAAIVPNKFKGNAAALAEWATAQRIARVAKTKPTPAATA